MSHIQNFKKVKVHNEDKNNDSFTDIDLFIEKKQKEELWRQFQQYKSQYEALKVENDAAIKKNNDLYKKLYESYLFWKKFETLNISNAEIPVLNFDEFEKRESIPISIDSVISFFSSKLDKDEKIELFKKITKLEVNLKSNCERFDDLNVHYEKLKKEYYKIQKKNLKLQYFHTNHNENENNATTETSKNLNDDAPKLHQSQGDDAFNYSNEITYLKDINLAQADDIHRLETKLESLMKENIQMKTKLSQLPQNIFNNNNIFNDYTNENNELKLLLSNLRKNIEEQDVFCEDLKNYFTRVFDKLDSHLELQKSNVNNFGKDMQVDIGRMRKERDQMRVLYETTNTELTKTNNRLANQTKNIELGNIIHKIVHIQSSRIEELKTTIDSFLKKEHTGQPEFTSLMQKFTNNEEQMYTEMEEIALAFEQLQELNAKINNDLEVESKKHSKLLSDKMGLEFKLIQVKKEAEAENVKSNELERISLERIKQSDEIDSMLRSDLKKHIDAQLGLIKEHSQINKQLADLKFELNQSKSDFKKIQSLGLNTQLEEKMIEVEKLKNNIKALELEIDALHKKLERHEKKDGVISTSEEVMEELSVYKKLMKCNTCHLRDKNAILSKCMHVFCRTCLDNRLETRQRKCPICAEPFGASEVKNIYL